MNDQNRVEIHITAQDGKHARMLLEELLGSTALTSGVLSSDPHTGAGTDTPRAGEGEEQTKARRGRRSAAVEPAAPAGPVDAAPQIRANPENRVDPAEEAAQDAADEAADETPAVGSKELTVEDMKAKGGQLLEVFELEDVQAKFAGLVAAELGWPFKKFGDLEGRAQSDFQKAAGVIDRCLRTKKLA